MDVWMYIIGVVEVGVEGFVIVLILRGIIGIVVGVVKFLFIRVVFFCRLGVGLKCIGVLFFCGCLWSCILLGCIVVVEIVVGVGCGLFDVVLFVMVCIKWFWFCGIDVGIVVVDDEKRVICFCWLLVGLFEINNLLVFEWLFICISFVDKFLVIGVFDKIYGIDFLVGGWFKEDFSWMGDEGNCE